MCQAEARSAGDESSQAHRGTSGWATGVTRLLNSLKTTQISQQLDGESCKIVLVQIYFLVSAL